MERENSSYQFKIHTFGCKVNTYDTGLLQKRLTAAGYTADANKPSVHILNTCAVTAEATKDAIKEVRRLKSREPMATIVLTGCSAQVDGKMLDNLPGVDLVVANSHKGQLEQILDQYFRGQLKEKVFRSNIFRKEDPEAGGGKELGHTRTFLKIQDGCNSFCTFCVIPFARGKSRSLSLQDLVARVGEFVTAGSLEVVLTGVHIGDYEDRVGAQKYLLHDLVREILERTTVSRLRLSSLEPVELTAELIELFEKNPNRLCRHFHMSIQSANTRVLQAMKRKYTAEQVELALLTIQERLPGSFVGMDVIAGFAGETDEEFEDTYVRLSQLPWTRLHVFPFSERPGTKAALIEEVVPRDLRALRAQRLRDLSSNRFRATALAQIGSEKDVLLLTGSTKNKESNFVQGLSRDYWPVRIAKTNVDLSSESSLGREMKLKITAFDESIASRMDGFLVAQPVEALP